MGKFNQSSKGTNTTVNCAGGTAYKIGDLKTKLTLQITTSFMSEPKFYGDNTNEIVQSVREMLEIDPKFIANMAIYCRKELHLRSVTHMLVGELAFHPNGKIYVRQTIGQVVERADDMCETLSYYINTHGKPIPNSLKKGIADIFTSNKFDEYQYAKYNRDGQIKLKDLILLTHPKPKNDSQSQLIKKILEDDLATPQTWETILSANDGRSKKDKWEEIIDLWVKVDD